jgi:hypothetical protein
VGLVTKNFIDCGGKVGMKLCWTFNCGMILNTV